MDPSRWLGTSRTFPTIAHHSRSRLPLESGLLKRRISSMMNAAPRCRWTLFLEHGLFTSTQSAGRSRLMMEASVLLTGSSLQQEQRRGDSQPELVLWRTMCGPMKMAFSWPRHSAARPSEWWLSEQDLLALKLHLLLGHSAMKSRCSKPLLFLCRQSLARNSDPGAQHSMSEMGQRC